MIYPLKLYLQMPSGQERSVNVLISLRNKRILNLTVMLPGFNDFTPQADLLCIFQQLQTQVDLSLDFVIRVDPRQVHPAV